MSIIVPVYNAEKSLNKCIDSLIHQTFNDIEILLVDDGSTDSSGKICDSYQHKDSRVKVFHLENAGVSNARNLGIKNSSGMYLHFVDSDDFIDKKMIEKLYKAMTSNDFDLALCGFNKIEKGSISTLNSAPKFNGNIVDFFDYLDILVKKGLILGPWAKLYKKEIILKYGIGFLKGLSFGEDTVFVYSYLMHCKNVSVLEECLYIYEYNSEYSLSSIQRKDKSFIYLHLYDLLQKLLIANHIKVEETVFFQLFCESLFSCISEYYVSGNEVIREERIAIIKGIVNHEGIRSKIKLTNSSKIKINVFKKLLLRKQVFLLDQFFKSKALLKFSINSLQKKRTQFN